MAVGQAVENHKLLLNIDMNLNNTLKLVNKAPLALLFWFSSAEKDPNGCVTEIKNENSSHEYSTEGRCSSEGEQN